MSRSRHPYWFNSSLDTLKKGRDNEGRVASALEQMRLSGEISYYYRTKAGGELDVRGVDFQVYPDCDWSIDLQVKSSSLGKGKHIKEYGHSIACIIVHDAMDSRQLLEELRRILGLSVQGIIDRH